MTQTAEARLTHVRSPDGTEIAVHVSGQGRPLVAVHGTTSDHTTWRAVLQRVEPYVCVYAMDRRGRGASTDGPDYSLAAECADVVAVVDAAAAATGSTVDVLGHSFGGNVAFRAAALSKNLRRLVLYEGWPVPNVAHRTVSGEVWEHLESLLAQRRPEKLLEIFYRDIALMSDR